jgi:hypothetical protein
MSRSTSDNSVRLSIVISAPPRGVTFAVQRGKSDLLGPSLADSESMRFELSLRVAVDPSDGAFNFLGEFAQGSRADRFVYINSGTYAGQLGAPWSRRAKLKLTSIPVAIVEAAMKSSQGVIQARVTGTSDDGGPICATVKTHAVEWHLKR